VPGSGVRCDVIIINLDGQNVMLIDLPITATLDMARHVINEYWADGESRADVDYAPPFEFLYPMGKEMMPVTLKLECLRNAQGACMDFELEGKRLYIRTLPSNDHVCKRQKSEGGAAFTTSTDPSKVIAHTPTPP